MSEKEHAARVLRAAALLFGTEDLPQIGSGEWHRELRAAFRRRAFETHPDRASSLGKPSELLEREFHAVSNAYKFLCTAYLQLPLRKENKNRQRHFHCGPIPRKPLRFAELLYYTKRISYQTLLDAIAWQRCQRPAIGQIAIEFGFLSEEDVCEIIESRRIEKAYSTPFGEHALRHGLLTRFQLLAMLGRQRQLQRPIGEFFVERGIIEANEIPSIRQAVIQHNLNILAKPACKGGLGQAPD